MSPRYTPRHAPDPVGATSSAPSSSTPSSSTPSSSPAAHVAEEARLRSIHPDCPDMARLASDTDVLRRAAARQHAATVGRDESWSGGFNRRTLLAGGLGVGVATLGTQLVTSRVSYASAAEESNGTLVVIFLRGGMDGLSMLVPADDPDLLKARPNIAVRGGSLMQMGRGFGLHPAMSPLKSLIDGGRLAAVPAVATPDLSRSHFQAQDCLERGSTTQSQSGWLDRVLEVSGPGTTFRSVAVGGLLPRSLLGTSGSLAMRSLDQLELVPDQKSVSAAEEALKGLYTGLEHPVATQAMLALDTLSTARELGGATADTSSYPDGSLGEALATLATLIKGGAGVRVATIDVGGWDMHTGIGTVDQGDMMRHLGDLSEALAAFTKDLGSHLDTTTVVTMSEFGRRVTQNASGGTDHGHGGVVLAMGGGVKGGVHGRWEGLGDDVLDQGDVPGTNDYRDVLSEIVSSRLGIGLGALDPVFPGWKPTPLGLMA